MNQATTDSIPYLRIYLTGFMGSGKSTLGAALADRLGYAFLDLDQEIVRRIEMPIAEYFQTHGEVRFRRLETSLLHETQAEERVVVAVGGGALVSEANLAFAREQGLVVYLMVDQGEIIRRLRAEQHSRPMLLDDAGHLLPEKRVEERIARLFAAREPYYHRAHLSVDLSGLSVDAAGERLRAEIEAYARRH
ncbi:MAG: shikimate kinase [Rhodothermales bacterium]